AQVLVVEIAPARCRRSDCVVPRGGGVHATLEDPDPGGLEQRFVLEEEPVGVEDLGFGRRPAHGRRLACAGDLLTCLAQGVLKPLAVCTKRAAGRACRPSGLRTASRTLCHGGPSSRDSAAAASVPAGAPRCAAFGSRPPRASAATSASGAPTFAETAAATAPS